jgi:hypothetical protein
MNAMPMTMTMTTKGGPATATCSVFAGARAHVCVCRPQTRHVLEYQSHVRCCAVYRGMTRIRSYGPANLVSCGFASWPCDWAGRVLRRRSERGPSPSLHPSLVPPFALVLSPPPLFYVPRRVQA